jgi:hypothetical protein
MSQDYVKPSNLLGPSPAGFAALGWLLLDRLGAPGWAFGVLWTLVVACAVVWLTRLFRGSAVDVVAELKRRMP